MSAADEPPVVDPATEPRPSARELLRRGLLRPGRTQLLVGLLCGLLGFGLIAQIDATSSDSFLRTARTSDLVQLLEDLGLREQRLAVERDNLEQTLENLSTGADSGQAALREARARARSLGILAGTLATSGSGVTMQVADPGAQVTAPVLLDAVQELRDAGAEAIQVGDTRVVASTAFTDGPGERELRVDGVLLDRPFEVRAVGDADTMRTALSIPGGAVDTIAQVGGVATVETDGDVEIDALRTLTPPRYARPAPTP